MIRRLRIISSRCSTPLLLLLGTGVGRVQAQAVPVLPGVPVSTELTPFRQGRQWGYLSSSGHVRIRPQYTYAEPFDHGLAKVWQGARCGFIDPRGQVVVPIYYDRAGYYQPVVFPPGQPVATAPPSWPGGRGLLVVVLRDTVTTTGYFEEKVPPRRLVTAPDAWQDIGWTQQPSTHFWGLYDSLGQVVLPVRYTGIRRRADGLLAAARIVDRYSGKRPEGEHSTMHYRDYPLYHEQLFSPQGRNLLPGLAYSWLGEIWYGHLLVKDEAGEPNSRGIWGLVDTARVADPTHWYSYIEPLPVPGFRAAVSIRGGDSRPKWVLLDARGERRNDQQYEHLYTAGPGQAIAAVWDADRQLRVGVLDLASGAWVIRPEYDSITYTPADGYQARQHGQLIGLEDDGVSH
jgi:hypothetical protein